jgi:uncharacterized membrane protein
MKIQKLIILAALLVSITFISVSCSSEERGDDSGKKSKSETEQLEQIKIEKLNEADSLKNEIKKLKQKRDSLNKALENEIKD